MGIGFFIGLINLAQAKTIDELAQGSDPVSRGFLIQVKCSQGTKLELAINKYKPSGLAQTALAQERDKLLATPNMSQVCIDGTVDGFRELATNAFQSYTASEVCMYDQGLIVPFDGNTTQFTSDTCCKVAFPRQHSRFVGLDQKCCQMDATEVDISGNCKNSNGNLLTEDKQGSEQVVFFKKATPSSGFSVGDITEIKCASKCGYDTSKNTSFSFSTPITVNDPELKNWVCAEDGTQMPASDRAHALTYCVQGVFIPQIDYETNGPQAYVTCSIIKDPANKAACEACFEKNITLHSSSFVWTGAGCVDNSQSGIITRVMQIGLGIMGGFSIWKLISAAILYQLPDPAKHQQAKEEVTSVFWGIIMIVGAIVILRFIGVNIWGIFPAGFI